MAIAVGALATTAGLLSPQRATAHASDCPVLAENPTTYATGEHCFTIPASVTSIHAVLVGGTGGDGIHGSGTPSGLGGLGGHGMQVSGDVAVTPGEVIWTYVGGNGTNGNFDVNTGSASGSGGFNGGARGGGDDESSSWAGGGGGATDLRTTQATIPFTNCGGARASELNFAAGDPSSFLLVAGGGGGGGNGQHGPINIMLRPLLTTSLTPDGGNGGSQPGDASPPSGGTQGAPSGGGGGGAATGSAGGAAGTGTGAGASGTTRSAGNSSGCGGTGGDAADGQTHGGGGGGGYNGGGGGGGGGTPVFARPQSGVVSPAVNLADGGGGGGGGGSDFHASAVTNYAESIDPPGPSATISFAVGATPTASVAPISVPATGGAPPPLNIGIWLFGIGAVLLGGAAIGRRRPVRTPRPPA
jgi:hypothetical protein